MPSFPSTTATTGPFTAEAGTTTNPAETRPQRSYSAGDVGVVLCRRLTNNGIHILTTWLCANVGYDFSEAQSKYLVMCQVGVQILQRCEPLEAHRRPLVVISGTGAEWDFDKVYGLSTRGLQQLIDTDYGRSVNLLALAVSGTIRGFSYAVAPVTQHTTSPPGDAPSTTAAGAGQPVLQRPAAVVFDNSAAIRCRECNMQLSGTRQFAGHLKGSKHQRSVRRSLRLELASLRAVQPVHERTTSPPRAPPSAEAGAGQQTLQRPTASAPQAQHLYRTYGNPAMRGNSYHLTDADVRKLSHGATKHSYNGGRLFYSNHTDRYQRDAGCRIECQNHVLPTPEHLYYENGDYVW